MAERNTETRAMFGGALTGASSVTELVGAPKTLLLELVSGCRRSLGLLSGPHSGRSHSRREPLNVASERNQKGKSIQPSFRSPNLPFGHFICMFMVHHFDIFAASFLLILSRICRSVDSGG